MRTKVRMFSDSALCVGVSNPDPPSNWKTRLEDVCYERGLVENLNLAAREVQFIWHMHIQRCVNRQTPESFDEGGSSSCLCSTTLDGQRKARQKLVCTMPQKWQHLRPISSQDTGASWGPRQKIRGGTEMFNEHQRTLDVVAWQLVDIFKCHTSHPTFQTTEPPSLGQLRK